MSRVYIGPIYMYIRKYVCMYMIFLGTIRPTEFRGDQSIQVTANTVVCIHVYILTLPNLSLRWFVFSLFSV